MSRESKSLSSLASRMGLLIVLGAGVGTALGAALGQVAMGVALGAALGVVTGAVVEFSRRGKHTN